MFQSFFQRVPAWDMNRAREHVASEPADSYQLVDVRSAQEFAEGHIPGAINLPLQELGLRFRELDPGKLTLVNCFSGGRAGNATAFLKQRGFSQVFNIGGMRDWNGMVASGAPEAGMAIFEAAQGLDPAVALARQLELGAQRFYLALAEHFEDQGVRPFFEELAEGEVYHVRALDEAYARITGDSQPPALPEGEGDVSDLMEGGVSIARALEWARSRPVSDVLEFLVAMEANAHDRYLHVARQLEGPAREVFQRLGEAERVHQQQLLELYLRKRVA
jgi:rhodanese-related sulfurtransferase/rubrerythrin